jgi:hypothetical protein
MDTPTQAGYAARGRTAGAREGNTVTEAEWLACTDPKPMLRFLIGTDYPRVQAVEAFPDSIGSDRKLRLFACACYHRIHHLLPDARAQAVVEVAEQVADGILPRDELQRAEAQIQEPIDALEGQWRASRGAQRRALLSTHEALALALVILWPEAQKAAYYASSNASMALAALTNPRATNSDYAYFNSQRAEERTQTDILRCFFGDLFHPATLAPTVLTWHEATVVRLAQAAYDERHLPAGTRDNARLAILADALEEAGCDNADILNHLRGPGPHVRGCWAVDLCLGKS